MASWTCLRLIQLSQCWIRFTWHSDSNDCSKRIVSDVKFPKCDFDISTVVQHSLPLSIILLILITHYTLVPFKFSYNINVHWSLHTHHVASVQDPEKLEVLVGLIKSTGHLLGHPRGRVEGNTSGGHELLQLGPLQCGHPLKRAWKKDKRNCSQKREGRGRRNKFGPERQGFF